MMADAKGFLYTVGCIQNSAQFQTTPGALRSKENQSMVFLQKLSPDGLTVLVSALIGRTTLCYDAFPYLSAKTDATGNTYLAFGLAGDVAGVSIWGGDSDGGIAVLKISSSGDKVLYATKAFPNALGGVPLGLDVDADGFAYLAVGHSTQVRFAKIDPAGVLTNLSYVITEPELQSVAFNGLSLAVGADHSLYVATSPFYVYRIDATGENLIYRVQAVTGDGKGKSLDSIAVDGAGNAYVVGSTLYQDGTSPMPVTPMGFSQTIAGSTHSFLLKVGPSGGIAYGRAFAPAHLTAIAVDNAGNAWAGGGSQVGFTIFELNDSGTGFLHYVSLPDIRPLLNAFDNQVRTITLDGNGQPLIAGATASFRLPNSSPSKYYGVTDEGNLNAFFLRISAVPFESDLQLSVSAPATTCVSCSLTYSVQLTNTGILPANNVLVKFPDFDPGDDRFLPLLLDSCRATGNGFCTNTGAFIRLAFPTIGPGATESAEFQLGVQSNVSPFVLPLVALTSTDDPNQANNYAFISTPVQTVRAPIIGAPAGFRVEPDGRSSLASSLLLPANTEVQIYVPTPQALFGSLYAFVAWGDGSTDNPRTFQVGTTPPNTSLTIRQVTEPWVSPDAPAVHAANNHSGAIAPGEMVVLHGYNLGPTTLQTASLDSSGRRLSTSLNGVQVFFDGVPAPIVFASASASSVIVPYSVAGKESVQMTIAYNQKVSAPATLSVTDSAPGLFGLNADGFGPLAALNSDGSLNSLMNPAGRGDIVALYASGEGLTNPLPADGEIAGTVAPTPQLPVTVSIGEQNAEVLTAGGYAGAVAGVIQITARVPTTVRPGLLPVTLTVGGQSSQKGGTIAVR